MNQKLGMDTIAARAKREAMQLQVIELLGISSDLSRTHSAASSPASYGIEPGEKTIAPWSINSVISARNEIDAARSAALDLFWRVTGEANAQDLASAVGTFGDVKWWRNWLTIPRSFSSAPAAFAAIISKPKNALDLARLGPFSRAAYDLGGDYLKMVSLGKYANPAVKYPLLASSWTKPADVVGALASRPFFNSANPWLSNSKTLLTQASGALKTGAFVASKGFGVLGIGVGVYKIVDGLQSGDGWSVADGIVGTITSLGSLAPPPVGVAFAAVGAAYTAGRWLFGADENGKTGIDHLADVGKNIGNFSADVGKNVANAGKAVGEKAAEVLDNLWPW